MDNLFQTLLERANKPVVPESVIGPTVNALTEPTRDQSVGMARLKGFGAGALEGARGLTTPLNLAMAAIPGGRAAKGAVGAARGVKGLMGIRPGMALTGKGLAGVTPELVQAEQAVKQVMPTADDVAGLTTSLGSTIAEFTPRGGEAAYNAARHAGMIKIPSPAMARLTSSVPKYLQTGNAAGEISPNLLMGVGTVAAGGYAGKKLYDLVQGWKASAQKANPFGRYAKEMDKALGQRAPRKR